MSELPRATPGSQGVDPAGVLGLLDAVEAHGLELHSLMVLRHGHVVTEGWWHPYSAERVHLLYSLSKSFTSAAAGLAVAEGLLDLDAPVLDHFPELDGDVVDPRTRVTTLRHLASMASGHEQEMVQVMWADREHPVRAFLLAPPERDPGSLFTYNQPCTYTLAAAVQRRTGCTVTEYLAPRLFSPLGIDVGAWQQAPRGQDLGFSGLHLTTEAVARFGQTLLDGGRWAGRQVLPVGWVEEASTVHVPTAPAPGDPAADPRSDWQQGYGLQFWRSRTGFRGDGAYGQFCLVLPEHDAVVVTTAGIDRMQAVLDAVWMHLLPAFGEVPALSGDAERALRSRLDGLALAVPPAGPEPAALPVDAEGTVRFEAGPGDEVGLGAVTLRRDGGRGGWEAGFSLDGSTVRVGAGEGAWVVTDPGGGTAPLAASLGVLDGQPCLDVAVLETPHRLRARLTDAGVASVWLTQPLGRISLRSMQHPLPGTVRRPTAGHRAAMSDERRPTPDPAVTEPTRSGEDVTPPHGDPLFSGKADDTPAARRKEQDGTAQGKQDDFGLDFVDGTPSS